MSLFCTEVLANRKGIFLMLKQLAMRFHYALERVVGLPKWFLIKLKLLKTICLPMYGLNLWSSRKKRKRCTEAARSVVSPWFETNFRIP